MATRRYDASFENCFLEYGESSPMNPNIEYSSVVAVAGTSDDRPSMIVVPDAFD